MGRSHEAGEEPPTDFDLPTLTVEEHSAQPITAVLELNGKRVPMEANTGAAVSLMVETTQRRLFPEGREIQSVTAYIHS